MRIVKIVGESGAGKTHLLSLAAEALGYQFNCEPLPTFAALKLILEAKPKPGKQHNCVFLNEVTPAYLAKLEAYSLKYPAKAAYAVVYCSCTPNVRTN